MLPEYFMYTTRMNATMKADTKGRHATSDTATVAVMPRTYRRDISRSV